MISPFVEARGAAPPEAARTFARYAEELASLAPPPEGLPELRTFVEKLGTLGLSEIDAQLAGRAGRTVAAEFHRRTGWQLLDAFGAFAVAAGLLPLPGLPSPREEQLDDARELMKLASRIQQTFRQGVTKTFNRLDAARMLEFEALGIVREETLRSWRPFGGRRQPLGGVAYFVETLLLMVGLPEAEATKKTHSILIGEKATPAATALCHAFRGIANGGSSDPNRNLRRARHAFRERLRDWPGELHPPKWTPGREVSFEWQRGQGDGHPPLLAITPGAVVQLPRPHSPEDILEAILSGSAPAA